MQLNISYYVIQSVINMDFTLGCINVISRIYRVYLFTGGLKRLLMLHSTDWRNLEKY